MSEFAGLLNQRIELWRKTRTDEPTAQVSDGFRYVDKCLASVEAEGVGNLTEAMTFSALPRYRVTVRAGFPCEVDMQIRWRDRRMVIRQLIANPLTPDRLTMRCEELR